MTTPNRIDRFEGPYAFLSNFWPSLIRYQGHDYPTVEHAFQAAKARHASDRDAIRLARSPGRAKALGRQCALRPDWEQVKYDIMFALVTLKFTCNEQLLFALLQTGDAYLEEGNDWDDRVWGRVDGVGENHLGQILMRVRRTLVANCRDHLERRP